MKKKRPGLRIPRPLAVVLAPAVALMMATIWFSHLAKKTAAATDALCAQFAQGGAPLRDFVLEARAAGFSIRDEGAGSRVMIAAKDVHGFKQQSFHCRASHDGQTVLGTAAEIVELK